MQDNANRNNLIIIVVIVASLLAIAYALISQKTSGLDKFSHLSPLRETPVPRFDWFDDIDAPVINNRQELSKVWQSKPRCCEAKKTIQKNNREFYKACYFAMQNYPSDEDIGAMCLWLMDGALETREQRLKHNEYYISRYFYYDKKLDNCANCAAANVSARIAQQLARQYKSANRFNEAVKLLERMNDERSHDTSDWVLAELSTQLGKYYLQDEYEGSNFERVEMNYFKLKPNKNNETLGMRSGKPGRFDKLKVVYLKLQELSKHKIKG